MGLAVLACGLLKPNHFIWFVALSFLIAAGLGMFNGPILPLMQKRVPEEKMGRITSLFLTISTIASPIGLISAGFGAEQFGITRWLFWTGALLCLLPLSAYLSKSIRGLDNPDPSSNHVIDH